MFHYAITRKPGPNFAEGLTTASLGDPDYDLLLQQHQAYVTALKSLDLTVIELGVLRNFQDAYFVEDVAVITPEVAVISRPGATARRGEENFIAGSLRSHRALTRIENPGTLDGGDVMIVGKHVYIGISARTNALGANQLGRKLRDFGYSWTAVPVEGGLHLKSDVNYIGRGTVLISAALAQLKIFDNFEKIIVDDEEIYAANSLLVNGKLLHPAGFPRTKEKLLNAGFELMEMNTSEIQKMDGGLSCMSLRF